MNLKQVTGQRFTKQHTENNMKKIIYLLLFVFLTHTIYAKDYHVSVTGCDKKGNGSKEQPYETIEKALSVIPANKNNTLYIGEGVFRIKKQIHVPSGVNIIGEGFEKTCIRCENYFDINITKKEGEKWQGAPVFDPKAPETSSLVFNGKNQTVKGLKFDGVNKKCITPILIVYGENMVFDGIFSCDFKVSGWWLHEGKNITLRNSKFKNNSFGNFNQDYGAVQFHRVDDLYIHDNLIDESDTHAYGIKMASKDQENMWSKNDEWQTNTVNDNINIFNNIINVGETGSWGVPGNPDSKVPTMSIEFNSGIECRAKIYNNRLNNCISIVSWEKDQDTYYEIYNNLVDFRKPDGSLNKYAYFVETNLDHFNIHHNLVVSGYYPLANWVDKRNKDCLIHHNIFYGAYGRDDLAFFYYGAGFDGYQFYHNTVIDLFDKGKIFEVRNKEAENQNASFKNNIFYSITPRGDILGDCHAVNGMVENNLFYNIQPHGEKAFCFDPEISFKGALDELSHYSLKATSKAIDAGVVIPGINDHYTGAAPDLGAIESGQEYFKVGVQNYTGPASCFNISCKGEENSICDNASSYLYKYLPMPMDTTKSLQYKWDNKQIIKSLLIDDMESLDNWEMSTVVDTMNVGRISLCYENKVEGNSSLKFVCPTRTERELDINERYWEWQFVTRKFNKEDFSEYNRISIQIKPEFEGFNKIYLMMILYDEGGAPDKYFRDGIHTFMLNNHEWNKVVMEIPHLPHDKVRGISIVYRLQGNEINAADTITYYMDDLRLECVAEDHYEGWNTNNEIVMSHIGYNCDDKKTAFTSFRGKENFKVINQSNDKVVIEKKALQQISGIGSYTVFDFSELAVPGEYRITYGELESKPFSIKENVWIPTIESCGYAIPGIHGECHNDCYTVIDGDTINLTGGWHDAGDLSQSATNTADAIQTLFRLSRKLETKNANLSKRMQEEALWGLKWLHKNRFKEGKTIEWTEIDRWTDGINGTTDDIKSQQPYHSEKYLTILANIEAAFSLKETDPLLCEQAKRFAIEDWYFSQGEIDLSRTDHLAMAVWVGAKLVQLTEDNDIKNKTIELANLLIAMQQTEPMNWTIPLSGFFYATNAKDRLFGYSHHFVVATPIAGLVELCMLFPDDKNYPSWYKSVKLYSEYIKNISRLTSPYNMIPANIYKIDKNREEGNLQILEGMKMDDAHYLRMFPVWDMFRGNNPIILSSGIGLAYANRILNDPELKHIAQSQLEWVLGKNPFNQSLMFGEGYDFAPQYAVMTDDITGGIPVGIQTKGDSDIPYWQASIFCNYKEVWIHCSNRYLQLLETVYY